MSAIVRLKCINDDYMLYDYVEMWFSAALDPKKPLILFPLNIVGLRLQACSLKYILLVTSIAFRNRRHRDKERQ